jgi:hypothetical protein
MDRTHARVCAFVLALPVLGCSRGGGDGGAVVVHLAELYEPASALLELAGGARRRSC